LRLPSSAVGIRCKACFATDQVNIAETSLFVFELSQVEA